MGKTADVIVSALGLSLAALGWIVAGGAFGAALSVRGMPWGWPKVWSFSGGLGAAVFLTPALADWAEVTKAPVMGAGALVIATFGLLLRDELAELVRSGAVRKWVEVVVNRRLGG